MQPCKNQTVSMQQSESEYPITFLCMRPLEHINYMRNITDMTKAGAMFEQDRVGPRAYTALVALRNLAKMSSTGDRHDEGVWKTKDYKISCQK